MSKSQRFLSLLLLAGLINSSATTRGEVVGGPKPKSYRATVRLSNTVDEAVRVSGLSEVILEPFETRDIVYTLTTQSREVAFTASLVSNPAVSATGAATLQKDRLTAATISATAGGLSIRVSVPTRVAANK